MNGGSEHELTERQRRVLAVIRASIAEHGYPPTIREIGKAVGLASPSSVSYQLDALARLGLLRRAPRSPRGMDIGVREPAADTVIVPLLGTIAAGCPIVAEEHLEEHLALPAGLVGHGEHFALRVRGDSMVGAAICDGDIVVIRQQSVAEHGDIVAALIDGDATVKTYRIRDGHVELVPHNDAYSVICGDEARILGKVVCLLRRF